MSEERVFLTPKQAMELIPDSENIHTFINNVPSMFVGADWSRNAIQKLFETGKELELAGERATNMKHGITVIDITGQRLFVATK